MSSASTSTISLRNSAKYYTSEMVLEKQSGTIFFIFNLGSFVALSI